MTSLRPPLSESSSGPATTASLVAIGALFFVNGASLASWFPRLPEIRDRLGVSEGGLGLTLVGMGLGGLLVSLMSGAAVDRFGSRRVSVVTSIVLSALLPLVGLASEAFVLFAVLIAMGTFDGLTDVAMNSQAIVLQEGRPGHVLSRLHGMWSIGTVAGGIVSAVASNAEVSMRSQLVVTSVVMIATTLTIRRWLLPDRPRTSRAPVVDAPFADGVFETPPEPATAAPPPAMALLARLFLVGTAVALTEAPPNDWASLMWVDHYDLTEGRAALGYVSIATGMVAGRFAGDFVVARFGSERTRRAGALLAAVGVVLAAVAPGPWPLSAIGLFATGVGASQLFPLMFAAASALTAGRSIGMAAFSSGARFGFLVGPPVIGGIAGLTSVATAVLLVAGLAALAVAITPLRPTK